jgi:hypothetical protein
MHMVLSIVYVAPASLVFVPKLKKVISGWQGSYLDNSDCSSACCALGDTPSVTPGDAIDCERR